MSFVDDVKSPMDNEDFFKSVITLYANQDKKTRASGSYIYRAIIEHPESESIEIKHDYLKNFKKYVESDTILKLLTEVLGYSNEDSKQIYIDLFVDDKPESSVLAMKKDVLIDKLEDEGSLNKAYDNRYIELNQRELLEEVFSGHGSMGYHIYESKFGKKFSLEDNTIKLYINAGADTYEFSKLFKEKCIAKELPFMYKVVNPYNDEHKRCDKMCIYSSLNDIESYRDIVNEIRKEHPNFSYRSPAPIMGVVDNWIGVGADPNNFEFARSYSESRAQLIENSLSSVIGNASKKKIMKMLEQNPEKLIGKLKSEIADRAEKYAITKHFVFDDVIEAAFEIDDPRKRQEFYFDNRSKLFPTLADQDEKISFLQRIKNLFSKKKKEKSNAPEHQLTIPSAQSDYNGDSISDYSDFEKRLRDGIPENTEIPISQTPIDKKQEKDEILSEMDKDDHDVWI